MTVEITRGGLMFESIEQLRNAIAGEIGVSGQVAQREPALAIAVKKADEQMQRLGLVVNNLTERLALLCRVETPNKSEPEKLRGDSAPIVAWFEKHVEQLERHTERLAALLSRLEV